MSVHTTQRGMRERFAPSQLMLTTVIFLVVSSSSALAGPFVDFGHSITDMNAWATEADETLRGPQNIATPGSPLASAGNDANVLGDATGAVGDTLSLGDGGSITVFLAAGIHNGPNNDFAVFENGFIDIPGLFAELAFVDVSSNGTDYARFEVDTRRTTPVSSFGFLDPSDYFGLAGRHEAFVGTGFDLAHLAFNSLVQAGTVDLMNVRYVRIVDVIGDGSTVDSSGNPIFDPYPTPFPEGGFDLEAVGIIHVPEPSLLLGLAFGLLGLLGLTLRPQARATGLGIALGIISLAGPAAALTSTFEDLGLGIEDFENGSGLAGGYTSGGIFYENIYTPDFSSFTGFAASTTTDTTTPGFSNQFSNITGSGAGGSDGFGIFYQQGKLVLPSVQTVLGAEFTNTTYAALSMQTGDAFTDPFGGPGGDEADLFQLIVEGLDAGGTSTGTVELILADYRFADNSLDYILDAWTYLDLSGLGAIKELSFTLASTDIGDFGINTPEYFAIDNLTTIPEPGTGVLLGIGIAALAHRRSPRR